MMKRMRLVFSMLFLGMCLLAATAQAKEAKVQLHDTIALDAFVEGYNKISENPVTDYSRHSTKGAYESYVAVVDERNVMLINTNAGGLISNILFMHRGDISDAEKEKLMSMFACANVALGYPATEQGMAFLAEAFGRLDIASPEDMASRLQRTDIQRDYTFFKNVNKEKQVHMILMEAVAE